ncbi:hypothetical protein ISF_08898 [Cordyceps fumosorosea ARSEF 2679]|uniref:MARVEL-like domain protein n=1 Tax=Cordyceps fumosorosea (strain ARSEF 2679) TaxID=1081104 RepID=A0A167LN42_CORFA|nr:hypothetical protein ISF_08898 [Cordyceps fumosorosea ARSEF 2679]OAA53284.1 hypothetical protein ISF_08898 [Cordyceps fumosorosea ARSEF 2679]
MLSRLNITKGYLAFSVAHFLLFVLGLTIIGLYATDVQRAREVNSHLDSKWIFAVVVGSLSSVTCLVYFVPFVFHARGIVAPIWNLVLFILNITLFGVFANLFLHAKASNGAVKRMKNAIWVDLTSALLWLLVALASAGYWWKHRDVRSRFTGRAHV